MAGVRVGEMVLEKWGTTNQIIVEDSLSSNYSNHFFKITNFTV